MYSRESMPKIGEVIRANNSSKVDKTTRKKYYRVEKLELLTDGIVAFYISNDEGIITMPIDTTFTPID